MIELTSVTATTTGLIEVNHCINENNIEDIEYYPESLEILVYYGSGRRANYHLEKAEYYKLRRELNLTIEAIK